MFKLFGLITILTLTCFAWAEESQREIRKNLTLIDEVGETVKRNPLPIKSGDTLRIHNSERVVTKERAPAVIESFVRGSRASKL
jgi:hypothetical protein